MSAASKTTSNPRRQAPPDASAAHGPRARRSPSPTSRSWRSSSSPRDRAAWRSSCRSPTTCIARRSGAWARPGRGPAAAGVLLRHAGPRPVQGRRGRTGKAYPGRARRHGRQAAACGSGQIDGSCGARRASRSRWTSCRRIRLLGVVQGRVHGQEVARRDRRQGAARPRCSRRSSGRSTPRTRRRASRCDSLSHLGPVFLLRGQAPAEGLRTASSSRCGSTPTARASSRSPPSATGGGLPGRRRVQGLSRGVRHRPSAAPRNPRPGPHSSSSASGWQAAERTG